jgi:hypothetical protein
MFPVMPAKAGIQYAAAFRFKRKRLRLLGPRLRGDDGFGYQANKKTAGRL